MYQLTTTKQFEKDYKLCKKRGLDMILIHTVLEKPEVAGSLAARYKTHSLKGQYACFLECHIQGDWLLVWLQNDTAKEITLISTGTHSDLF